MECDVECPSQEQCDRLTSLKMKLIWRCSAQSRMNDASLLYQLHYRPVMPSFGGSVSRCGIANWHFKMCRGYYLGRVPPGAFFLWSVSMCTCAGCRIRSISTSSSTLTLRALGGRCFHMFFLLSQTKLPLVDRLEYDCASEVYRLRVRSALYMYLWATAVSIEFIFPRFSLYQS